LFKWFADGITYKLLGFSPGEHFAESLNFFLYDVPKIYFLLLTVMFFVAIIRSFLPPERIRKILEHKRELVGNFLAAVLGVFTPFCTCSAVPLFIGMLEAGVPLGTTMSFLVSSPTINEVALILLWGIFGWKVALIYLLSGMTIAVVSGFIIGRLKMEKYLENFAGKSTIQLFSEKKLAWEDRIRYAYEYTIDIFKAVWLYVMIGVGIGAFIHGYVPVEFVAKYAGADNPFAVIIAILIGIPLYANGAGAIPVVQAILEKGLPLGTSLAFMMAVTGLSLPEFLILRTVMKLRLLCVFFGIVAFGIITIGYLFNLVF